MVRNDDVENRPRVRPSGEAPAQPRSAAAEGPLGRPSSARRWSVGAVCLLLALVGLWLGVRRHSAAGVAKALGAARGGAPVVPVVAGKVAQEDVPIYLDGLGTVQAFNTVTVRVRVDGQLQALGFVEGQDVHPGDLLAQIDPDPYRTQVEQDEAKKKEDEAQLANAKVQLLRDTELLAQKIVAPQDYDAQKALVAQLEATVSADQAAVDSAKVQLNYTRVVSPIEGRTGIRLVDVGNIVKANDSNGIVVITQLRPISVVFTLPEQTLNEIQQQRSQGDLSVLAVGRDNRTVLDQGKLAVIDNQIDTTTGTIKLKATFPNPNLRLWPGQFVNARLLLATRRHGITVPASVIQRGPEGPYAFVIGPDMKVTARRVQIAQTADGKDIVEAGQALIESGLQPGEPVVVDGQYKLQIGSRVKPSPAAKVGPAANPEDSGL